MPAFPKEAPIEVRTNQARVLVVLASEDCPPMTKAAIAEAAGFQPGAGTINLSINGRNAGKGGKDQLGLIEMGLVRRLALDIDGKQEVVYLITGAGREALRQWMEKKGGLPTMRDKGASTNKRYQGGPEDEPEQS